MAILTLLKNNWKSIASVLFVGGLFLIGFHYGAAQERLHCQIEIQRLRDEQQTEKDRLQNLADQKAQEYEESRQKAGTTLESVKRRLADEQKKNLDYDRCRAGAVFLQLYTETIRAGATSGAAR